MSDPRPADIVRAWLDAEPRDLHLLARTVLMDLADRAGSTGQAWESAANLARRYGVHRSSVFRAMHEIETVAAELVTRRRRSGLIGVWVFHRCAPVGAHSDVGGARPWATDRAPVGDSPRARGRPEPKEPKEPRGARLNTCSICDGRTWVNFDEESRSWQRCACVTRSANASRRH